MVESIINMILFKTCGFKNMHTYIYTCIHTYMHTYVHTYTPRSDSTAHLRGSVNNARDARILSHDNYWKQLDL